jgi:uroporphyrinogen-III decarboxylase
LRLVSREETKWKGQFFTPKGQVFQERAFEPAYESGAIRKHYVEEQEDYEILWSYLENSIIMEDYARCQRDQAELGEAGLPLVAVERSPWQQLWVIWVGLERLAFHLADCPDLVYKSMDLLALRARKIFELAYRSPAPMIDFPDNITAPAIGLKRFEQYCVPLYNELAEMLAERGMPVFVHMDGDLQPLWQAIAACKIGGIDSLSPTPDNDTSVAQAIAMWPDKRLFVNFPSSVHLRSYDEVRAEAENILQAGGHSGRLEIQFSENVPHSAWRTSFRAVADAVDAFKP